MRIDRATRAPSPGRERFGWLLLVLILYLLVSGVVMMRHEIWSDEMIHWMEARDSRNLVDLLKITRFDRDTRLWDVSLFFISRLTRSPLAMQALHWLLAGLNVFLILKWAPFRRPIRILFVFGYFFLFEYGVLARCYAGGVLALILYLRYRARRPERPFAAGLLLALAANANLHMAIVASALAGAWGLDILRSKEKRRSAAAWAALAIFFLGLGLAFWQVREPAHETSMFKTIPVLGWNPARFWNVMMIPGRAFFPVPPLELNFWNRSILENASGSRVLQIALSLLVLAYAALRLRRSRTALRIFALGLAAMLAFSYIYFYGLIRHHGHIFLLFIAALWVAAEDEAKGSVSVRPRRVEFGLILILAGQIAAGLAAAAMDYTFPFSRAKAVARFIERHGYADWPIAGDFDLYVCPISGYLDKPFYYPREDRVGTYVLWDDRLQWLMDFHEVLDRIKRWAAERGGQALVILNAPTPKTTPEEMLAEFGLRKIASTPPAIAESDRYALYILRRDPVRF